MPVLQSSREEVHDVLCEEFLRERAAVLSRAGMAVEKVLAELALLDQTIQLKSEQLGILTQNDPLDYGFAQWRELVSDINASIDQFNSIRKKAQLKYYYFIVTREALGLRRHDRVQEIYKIPVKKKKVQAF